jgi:hypothetical protein
MLWKLHAARVRKLDAHVKVLTPVRRTGRPTWDPERVGLR